jgi:hypothetical protein
MSRQSALTPPLPDPRHTTPSSCASLIQFREEDRELHRRRLVRHLRRPGARFAAPRPSSRGSRTSGCIFELEFTPANASCTTARSQASPVSIGARVAAHARSGEILVSQTIRARVACSGFSFEDRGTTELKGVPSEWRLSAVGLSQRVEGGRFGLTFGSAAVRNSGLGAKCRVTT